LIGAAVSDSSLPASASTDAAARPPADTPARQRPDALGDAEASRVAAEAAVPPEVPTLRFLLTHPAHFLALGFGSGLPRIAPGTWGTLFAWASYIVVARYLGDRIWLLIVAALVLGTWAAHVTGRHLSDADSGHIVIDEIVAFWIVLAMLPTPSGTQQLWAFLLFRLFDITKPSPIRGLDARMKNGVGVMLDDLVAAFYTLLVLALVLRIIEVVS
jgi:phosphatidylglycerophosphatase A